MQKSLSRRTSAVTMTALALVLAAAPAAARQHPDTTHAAPPDTAGAFRIYTARGTPANLDGLIAAASSVDVVFLGESHNDRVGHRVQLAIFERLMGTAMRAAGDSAVGPSHAQDGSPTIPARDPVDVANPDSPVVLSLEMFETDVQYIVDEYLHGLISSDQFRRNTRPWAWYDEDYAPVVEAAKNAGLPVIAANAPRRYVNLVGRSGPDALAGLSEEARRFLPPLPYEGPSAKYHAELVEVMGGHDDGSGPARDSVAQENGFLAQSLWDATMAHSIAQTLLDRPGSRIVHLVGSFHVKNGTGIPEQLERYRPGTRRLIVFIEPVDDVNTFPPELTGAGDFVVLTDRTTVRGEQRTGSTG
jgi:uncharacterized iron-regulated protein